MNNRGLVEFKQVKLSCWMARSTWGISPRSGVAGCSIFSMRNMWPYNTDMPAQPPPLHLQHSDSSPSPTRSSHPLGSILESVLPCLFLTSIPFTLHIHISSHINPTAQVIKRIMLFLKLPILSYVTNQICPFKTSLDSNRYSLTIIIHDKQSWLLFFSMQGVREFPVSYNRILVLDWFIDLTQK